MCLMTKLCKSVKHFIATHFPGKGQSDVVSRHTHTHTSSHLEYENLIITSCTNAHKMEPKTFYLSVSQTASQPAWQNSFDCIKINIAVVRRSCQGSSNNFMPACISSHTKAEKHCAYDPFNATKNFSVHNSASA